MKTEAKCVEIIKAIQKIVNEAGDLERTVLFSEDFGGNSLTIQVDESHTHVGSPDGSFSGLVDDLFNLLTGGPHLSFVPPLDKPL